MLKKVSTMSKRRQNVLSMSQLIQRGDYRVMRLLEVMWSKYSGVPNVNVIAHLGYGTGCDIIVFQGNRILELREVTNYKRIAKNGKPIFLDNATKQRYIDSLNARIKQIYWGSSRKRLYQTETTVRFFDISYDSNFLRGQRNDFQANNIEVMVWDRTERARSYFYQDKNGKFHFKRSIQVPSWIIGRKGK